MSLMPGFPSANDENFNRREAPRPLREAVEQLSLRSGRALDDLERLTMRDISELATETYGAELPEFWRVWNDWHGPNDQIQPMGDL